MGNGKVYFTKTFDFFSWKKSKAIDENNRNSYNKKEYNLAECPK
jgi:hypothetical protein